MGVRKVLFVAALTSALLAAVTGVASAARHGAAASVTTIKAIHGPGKFQINRFVEDTLRWNEDTYSVPSGGTLHIVNLAADEGPHTFTVIALKDEPKTLKQLFSCSICQKLAKAHGADPNSNAPPKFQYLENGVGQSTPPDVDKPGDSGITGKGKKGESIDLKVTAKRGAVLRFMCLIHPWMQAKVIVG